jgi:ABC-type amino acid transport substrate-binding protein
MSICNGFQHFSKLKRIMEGLSSQFFRSPVSQGLFDFRTDPAYFKLLQTLISDRDKMDFVKRLAGVMTLLMILAAIYTEAQGQTKAGRTLIVGTKEVPPFAMKNSEGTWTGVSIDLWQQIASELSLSFEFRELDLQSLIDGVADGSLDVAVAALSITAEREEICDFSHPYYVTGLGIAIAPKHKTPWLVVLKKLFSSHYLKVVIGLCVLLLALGTLIWWFEHKRNPEQFGGGTAAGIGSGFWWSAVTMTTVGYGDKAPITLGGRVVAFIWMLIAIVIVSIFTATITSTLTVAHLDVPVKGPQDLSKVRVGAIADTTGKAYLRDNGISYTSYITVSEGLRAIMEDSIQALVYDAPILRYLIHHEFKGGLEVLPHTFHREDYGIALPKSSSLREPINRVLLEKIHGHEWQDIIHQYLGGSFDLNTSRMPQ